MAKFLCKVCIVNEHKSCSKLLGKEEYNNSTDILAEIPCPLLSESIDHTLHVWFVFMADQCVPFKHVFSEHA